MNKSSRPMSRWGRESSQEDGTMRIHDFNSIFSETPSSARIENLRKEGGSFRLPSPVKFRSGLMPGSIPVPRGIPLSGKESRSESDLDTSSDSEDEGYGARLSLDYSYQDEKLPDAVLHKSSASDHVMKKFEDPHLNVQKKMRLGFVSGAAEGDELSDSASTNEVSYVHCKKSNPAPGIRNEVKQDRDMPSAPPISSGIEDLVQRASGSGANTTTDETTASKHFHSNSSIELDDGFSKPHERIPANKGFNPEKGSLPPRFPQFHVSGQSQWSAVISYDACVRLCLHSWAKGCTEEAPYFLNNECTLLRTAFGLQHVLLQPEEELLANRTSSELVTEGATPKPKKTCSKMKVQVRRVKLGLDLPDGCSFSSLNPSLIRIGSFRRHLSNINSALHSGWEDVRKVRGSSQCIKQVSMVLKNGVTTPRNSPSPEEVVHETYTCLMRLKSSDEEDSVRMQPGSGETHVFFPDNQGDDLIIQVQDSKGQSCGRVLAQVAAIVDDPTEKLRWWPIYREPGHDLVGRIQLHISYSSTSDDANHPKCGSIAETVAYDFVLETAMKVQHFQQSSLLLHGQWKWLVTEFASYYGLSDAYTKLRYLSYVMDVATPTRDCLELIYDLLKPVLVKGNRKTVLSRQENRILGEVEDQIQDILALAFENYKSLDELSPSGILDVFSPATGSPASALAPAVKLYALLHDILSSEAQSKLCRYFQAAARKRSRRHLAETDEFISNNDMVLADPLTFSSSYRKMKSLILSIRNEIYTDIQIHNQHVLPSFLDLPNICASIYSMDLSSRLSKFLVACPPPGPSTPVADLVIATADFQMDLSSWNISHIKGGVDAKELFHFYITIWIQDKRLTLLDMCRPDKVKLSGGKTQHSTAPFVDELYERLNEMLNEYEVIVSRWPEYISILDNAIADVEKAIIDALEKQYVEVLTPLKDSLGPKFFGFVQKLAKRTGDIYFVPEELGVLLNSMKRMLDVLQPKIQAQLNSRTCCFPDGSNSTIGDTLGEISVMLRSKYRTYLHAVVEKLIENTRMQQSTKLRRIIQNSSETLVEADVRSRMQPLTDLLIKTIDHLHSVVEPHVFIYICRGLWDRMGQEVLRFLQNRRESRAGYKCSRIAVSVLDDIFASQMQQLLGNTIQEKDLEPPRSIKEARSVLCKDGVNQQENNYYY
ncbi:unnamed protein product [Linum tenue]|uniref:Uncharacterized protein n=1 Tax=Linum tenue TaxID=586396 RepID=A0AAV0KIV6_9ROSI|nr:unnamed protein product [Linum tenue]